MIEAYLTLHAKALQLRSQNEKSKLIRKLLTQGFKYPLLVTDIVFMMQEAWKEEIRPHIYLPLEDQQEILSNFYTWAMLHASEPSNSNDHLNEANACTIVIDFATFIMWYDEIMNWYAISEQERILRIQQGNYDLTLFPVGIRLTEQAAQQFTLSINDMASIVRSEEKNSLQPLEEHDIIDNNRSQFVDIADHKQTQDTLDFSSLFLLMNSNSSNNLSTKNVFSWLVK
jgi:hypothetical protein